MRPLLILLLIAASSPARADETMYTPLVEVGKVDWGCRTLAQIPRNARIPGPSYDAAISTANCMVAMRTYKLALTPTPQSVRDLDDAVAPAFEILDRVIAAGDPAHALLAEYAKLAVLVGNTARMFSAVPALSPQMTSKEVYDHYKLVGVTDALIDPWRQRAMDSRRKIASLVRAHPDLAKRDQVFAYVVADSRIERAPVATR